VFYYFYTPESEQRSYLISYSVQVYVYMGSPRFSNRKIQPTRAQNHHPIITVRHLSRTTITMTIAITIKITITITINTTIITSPSHHHHHSLGLVTARHALTGMRPLRRRRHRHRGCRCIIVRTGLASRRIVVVVLGDGRWARAGHLEGFLLSGGRF